MNNKLLFGTTALAAVLLAGAAQAADPGVTVKVAGFAKAFFQVGGISSNQSNGAGNLRSTTLDTWNNEVWFIAEGTAANGLKYGARIELEGTSQDDQIDESYMWLQGDWGKLELGNDDNAVNQIAYFIPAVTADKAIGIEDPDYYPNFPAGAGSTFRNFNSPSHYDGDASKLVYFSPRLAGFQAAVSYAPSACEDNNTAAGAGGCNNGGFEQDNAAGSGGAFGDAIAFALNYTQKYGDLGVTAAVGYYHDSGDLATAGDRSSITVGAGISYKGFDLGANWMQTSHYARQAYTLAGSDNPDATLNQYLVGARYTTGAWSFGGQFGYGKITDAAGTLGRDDKLVAGMIGAGYTIATGLSVDAGVMYYDWSSDTNGVTNLGANQTATVGLIGTVLSF
ncbi:porin [Zavarzinia sp.]|uniref:porin n=1 Tax=Zavarzinia sp. TaxID=2027920 RepID=UPI00356638F3